MRILQTKLCLSRSSETVNDESSMTVSASLSLCFREPILNIPGVRFSASEVGGGTTLYNEPFVEIGCEAVVGG